jgi:hypothetical protein
MNWHRRFRILGLTLVLLAGVSCSTSDGSLTGIPDPQPTEQPSALLGDLLGDLGGAVDGLGDTIDNTVDGLASGDLGGTLDGAVGGILEITDLLTCSEQKYVAVTRTVGPKGGIIKVGNHALEIPANALSSDVTISAEQMPGSTNSVRFSPEGLRFEKPARLTMSYKNCLVVLLPKSIVYTSEKFKILEVFRSIDLFGKKLVKAPIDHFSRYAIAY